VHACGHPWVNHVWASLVGVLVVTWGDLWGSLHKVLGLIGHVGSCVGLGCMLLHGWVSLGVRLRHDHILVGLWA
jgi:hypothetical protein